MCSKPTCPVCCDAYTRDKRKPVTCPGCSYAACCGCVKQYLLSAHADPCCMNCGLYWNRAFLDAHMTPSWRNGALRKHREHVLLDREKSMLPATQPQVEAEVRLRAQQQSRRDGLERIRLAREELRRAQRAYYGSRNVLDDDDDDDVARDPAERRSFVAKCPDANCLGFLSTQYKCGTCSRRFCPACRELKSDDAHECDPATVETMALISKECRACPSCGMAITRVSGCDHMWCTSCETGFSYATGKRIADGINTNPHMYERMRQLRHGQTGGGEIVDVETGESPRGCGREFADWPSTHYCTRSSCCGDRSTFVLSMHQCGRHVMRVVLPQLPTTRADTSKLRVRYCLKDIDESRFSALLQQQEKKRERQLELRATLEVFVLIVFQFFSEMERLDVKEIKASCEARCSALEASLRELVNDPLQNLADLYGTAMPRIETSVSPRGPVGCSYFSSRSHHLEDFYSPHGHAPRKHKKSRSSEELSDPR